MIKKEEQAEDENDRCELWEVPHGGSNKDHSSQPIEENKMKVRAKDPTVLTRLMYMKLLLN